MNRGIKQIPAMHTWTYPGGGRRTDVFPLVFVQAHQWHLAGWQLTADPLSGFPPKHVTTDAVSELEMEILKTAFHSSAEGGVLSRAQLAAVLRDVGFGPVPSDRLFDLFDADGNGEVRSLSREEVGRGTGRGCSVVLYSPKITS